MIILGVGLGKIQVVKPLMADFIQVGETLEQIVVESAEYQLQSVSTLPRMEMVYFGIPTILVLFIQS